MSDRETLEQNLRDAEKNAEAANKALQAAREALRETDPGPTPDELLYLEEHGYKRGATGWDWTYKGPSFEVYVYRGGNGWNAYFYKVYTDIDREIENSESGETLLEALEDLRRSVEASIAPALGALRVLRGEG
jgi:hypothetical protein